MITGLQTMPSVAWYPLALLLFKLSEGAILFVVVLGAAPAIANGLINGIDTIQPVLLRAGRVLGARRWAAFRSVILPAALPSFRRRAEAGVGVRVAQPARRRGDRRHRGVLAGSAAAGEP